MAWQEKDPEVLAYLGERVLALRSGSTLERQWAGGWKLKVPNALGGLELGPYRDLWDLPFPDVPEKLRTPPGGGSGVLQSCEHKFVFLRQESTYKPGQRVSPSGIPAIPEHIDDVFFCEKCLLYEKRRVY